MFLWLCGNVFKTYLTEEKEWNKFYQRFCPDAAFYGLHQHWSQNSCSVLVIFVPLALYHNLSCPPRPTFSDLRVLINKMCLGIEVGRGDVPVNFILAPTARYMVT